MKLSELYNQAIRLGRRYDPRGNRHWRYSDSAILYGSPDAEVRKILVGIDIEVGELLLADKLRQTQGLDLVISHHPEGWTLAHLYDVMQVQVDMLESVGIEPAVAHQLIEERKAEVQRKLSPVNHMRTVDVARILNLPFMCLHTPADNHASFFIQRLLKKNRPNRLEEIINILSALPEYREARKNYAAPRIILGNPRSYVGKIFVEMTGGTEGSKQAFKSLAKKGVRTLVSMHLSEEHFRQVKESDLNVVVAGHISSDTLGLNLLLDGIEKKERLEIINCSGFRRFNHDGRIYSGKYFR
ncbi:MAG: NGG1p interacting factor NIF3 [Candidatus Omnitrophota bacterium]|nr:MAG: NGG1p interacting factor NIF3 [Candidatus Omnitrophota bacterium]